MVVEKRKEGWQKAKEEAKGRLGGLERKKRRGKFTTALTMTRRDVEDEVLAATTMSGDGGGDAMAEKAQVVEPEAEKAELAG